MNDAAERIVNSDVKLDEYEMEQKREKEKNSPVHPTEGLELESTDITVDGEGTYIEVGDCIYIVPDGTRSYVDKITTSYIKLGFMYSSQELALIADGEEYSPEIHLQNGRISVSIPSGCTLRITDGDSRTEIAY